MTLKSLSSMLELTVTSFSPRTFCLRLDLRTSAAEEAEAEEGEGVAAPPLRFDAESLNSGSDGSTSGGTALSVRRRTNT